MSQAPYPGLRPFTRGEADIFFGREAQTDELVDRLGRSRFLSVVGPSGCGKSSLVRAGLLDALESGFMAAAGAGWHVAEMRPGSRPMWQLADALLTMVGRPRYEHDSAFLQAALERGPGSLFEYLHDLPLPKDENLLILVDQFEEIFRFAPGADQEDADAFVALLLAATQKREQPVYVVITMRSDFIGDCARFAGLPEAVNEAQFLTPRMTREQSRQAIESPARVFGGEVAPALVNRLLNDMGTDPDQLPLMQHALMRMWTRASSPEEPPARITLTLDDYKMIGGLSNALSNHANEAFDELDKNDQQIVPILFRVLTERGPDRRDTRRPTSFGKVVNIALAGKDTAAGRAQVERVVAAFRRPDRSFIMPPESVALDDATVLDISHESLIRQWDKLTVWVREEADAAETYRELLPPARRWQERQGGLLRALGGLWRGLNLRRAIDWQRQSSAGWAALYGGDFGSVERFIRASRVVSWLRTLLFTAVAVLAVGGVFLFQQQELRRQQERRDQERLYQQERTRSLFESQLAYAALLARVEDYATVKTVLQKTRELDDQVPAARRHTRNLLARFGDMMGSGSQQVYEGAGVPAYAVAVSPDGRLLAAAGENGTVVLFDVERGALRQRLEGHSKHVRDVVFHPQGAWLASAGEDQQIIRWSLPSGDVPAKPLQAWEPPAKVQSLAVSPDGKLLVSGDTDGIISLWQAETGELVRRLEGHSEPIAESGGLAFSPSGKLLASGSWDDTARVWDVETGETLQILKGHNGDVQGVAFSPDEKRIATSSDDKRLMLWEVESGQPLQVFDGHQNWAVGVGFVPRRPHADTAPPGGKGDAPLLVSSSYDRTLRVWDTDSGVTLRVLQGHSAAAFNIAAHTAQGTGQGVQVFSASNDGTVRRWDIAPLPYQQLVGLPGSPLSAAIAPSGKYVAVGFDSGALRLYSLPEMRVAGKQENAHESYHLSFNADGTLLASAGFSDHTAKLWAVTPDGTLTERQTFSGHESRVFSLAFSPDGMLLATASYDGRVGLFTVGTQEKRFIDAHEGGKVGGVETVDFYSSGTRLLSVGYYDKTVRLWDLTTNPPTQIQAFPKAQDELLWATLSPDGQAMASVGRGQVVEIYSTHDAQLLHRLVGHESAVWRAIFSPDGHQLATVSADATLRLWDLDTGGELFSLRLPTHMGSPAPLWDFDFRCTPTGCWIAVPLTRGKLALYEFGKIDD
jgi:WD40 repeat protein